MDDSKKTLPVNSDDTYFVRTRCDHEKTAHRYQSFDNIRSDDFYYVDKTRYVYELTQKGQYYYHPSTYLTNTVADRFFPFQSGFGKTAVNAAPFLWRLHRHRRISRHG